MPFMGVDIWNAYELSWLGSKGKPEVAIAQFEIPCDSPNLVESKSLKLYLNSLNHSKFDSAEKVRQTLTEDVSLAVGKPVRVELFFPSDWSKLSFEQMPGLSLDRLDIDIDPDALPNPELLSAAFSLAPTEQTLYSHLLRSNCPVTAQPDWASIYIDYVGAPMNEEGLLKYLIAFRNHQEFHEHCVEKIFCDIKKQCKPAKLSVYARYTRRGGLDINPYRTDSNSRPPKNIRLTRQ
jgi:7-cyano-7-deazaguanine reductase